MAANYLSVIILSKYELFQYTHKCYNVCNGNMEWVNLSFHANGSIYCLNWEHEKLIQFDTRLYFGLPEGSDSSGLPVQAGIFDLKIIYNCFRLSNLAYGKKSHEIGK